MTTRPQSAAAQAEGAERRVLVIGSQNYFDTMEWHVLDALRQLHCEVQFADTRLVSDRWGRVANRVVAKVADMLAAEPERLAERRILRLAERFEPTLVLVILGSQLSPRTVARLRQRTRAPIVCWCQDALTNLGRQYLLGAEYDAVFVKDRYMQDHFSRMIASTSFHYLPEACNPRIHRPAILTAADVRHYGCDVMIAGSLYYYRQEILQQLGEFDLRIFGATPRWLVNRVTQSHEGREIYGEEKARAAVAARIALNTLHYAEIDSLNCRAFELAGCGAFQLISARQVLREHFEPGAELDTFSSTAELIEKIRHYLGHPEAAAAMARRGQLRAHREHTYELRLQEICRRTGT
jgi:spore maturation protein CgeB